MKFRAKISFLVLLILAVIGHALHLEQSENPQLQALKDKQQYLRNSVKALSSYSSNINAKLDNTTSDKQKVQILQEALSNERQTIFDLKNKVIYPLNQSETACKQLTDIQKTAYLQKINSMRAQLTKLQQINKKLNLNAPQVQNVNDDIQKQFILLQNMEDILNTKCKQNLSPTIFQSNLKSKNWILGPQTMKDLKQQYAQRALIFHNITNCPLQSPFYDSSSQTCIKCEEPTPLFNMFTKQCVKCEADEQFDADKKNCKSRAHYTNFTRVKNWNLDGGSFPQIDKTLTPCPDQKPYYNSIVCVPCDLPFYWSVASNLCKKCQKGFSFDMNTQNCQKVVKYQLTILQNTKWVSSNLTQIIQDRTKILGKHKTTGNYIYCPNKSSPYFDGTTCVSCDYFDIDNLKCIKKPDGLEYDDNMKRFLYPENKKQTNPTATRYISANKLSDSDLVNCNSSYPYYDGLACIKCLAPFDIFNVDEKKCVACSNDQIFVENLHVCQPRKKIRISQNFDRLLATPKVTVAQYKQTLIKTINDNPDAIIYPCQQKNQYSNLTDCFPCGDGQYFNVQKLKCQTCDGVYFDNNQTCKAKVYIFTNLKAPKIVDMDGTTVDDENKKISDFLTTHPGSYVCAIDTPYAIQNRTCGNCPELFSYSELKCKQCAQFYIYVADTRKCAQARMMLNFTDTHRILVSETETLTSFKQQQQKVKNDNPNTWKICPGGKPYTDNRDSCFNCTGDTPYFNYTVKQCQNCPDHYVFDPQTVKCTQQFFITLVNSDTKPKMFGYDNYTMSDFNADQQAYKKAHPIVLCNASEPFGTVKGCRQCNQPTFYFDIKRKECSDVKFLINFQKISPDYIVPTGKSLDLYISEEQKYRKQATFLTKKCPDANPYTQDRISCFNCSADEYFNFLSRKCEKCPEGQSYLKNLKTCKQPFYVSKITPVTQVNMKGYANYTLDSYKIDQADIKQKNPYQYQQCLDNAPYGTTSGCQQCQQPTPYFDIKKLACSGAKKLINFNSVGNNYILSETKNLSYYRENQNNYKLWSESLTVDCPAESPFTSDRDNCFVCKDPEPLFNFETRKCESCPRGAEFSLDKKKCLRLFYITNFNDESQKKMVGTKDYGIADYKTDQQKLRKQNPYKDCNSTEPYGTLEGCRKCLIPEQYFDVKNRVCTSVKKLINFDAVGNNYVLREGRSLDDQQKNEQNYALSSDLPTVVCAATTPFTSNRDDCFACTSQNLYFNFESKACQSCSANQAYDSSAKKCVKKQYFTLFTTTIEKNLLESDNYTLSQYKKDQAAIKSQAGSSQCTSALPYASSNGCIQCNATNPYFNIKSQSCQSCDSGKVYFEANHQCLTPAYLTDFSNLNIKEGTNFTVDDAKKIENERGAKPGYTTVKCSGSKPFATLDGCIACNDTKAPYFNIKTLICEGCRDFYQYFKDRKCNDYIILTNTQEMIGYFEVDNFTKYNVEKMNNFTFISNPNITKFCPADSPFFNIDNKCVACNTTGLPIFNLKERKCMNVESMPLSNPQYMKFYIEKGDSTMTALKKEIDFLQNKKVNVQLCGQDKPYLSHNECVACPSTTKYFDLATEVCKTCDPGDVCIGA